MHSKFLISLLFLSSCGLQYKTTVVSDFNVLKESIIIYDINLPNPNGFFSKKISIEKNSKKAEFIRFPKGGTVTDIQISSLQDSFYTQNLSNLEIGLLWNISNISSGFYRASYSTCNNAVSFEIEIKTKEN